MECTRSTVLQIGDWRVDPVSGEISRNGGVAKLEFRTMRLLLFLAEHAGEIVSIDSLLNHVWDGVSVTSDSVYQSITTLRRLLGDDAKQPKYIATVPRRGYRLVATVEPWDNPTDPLEEHLASSPQTHPIPAPYRRIGLISFAVATLLLASILGGWLFMHRGRTSVASSQASEANPLPQQRSVAVLPFLDLTEGMKQGEFTDGMTEELIDQLSKVSGLQVPSPTSSFYFRDTRLPLSTIASKLGVSYVLDGSVRKSGARVRVAARLVRADTGYVMWSETYDRPWHYALMVQDDVAGELTKAVQASLKQP